MKLNTFFLIGTLLFLAGCKTVQPAVTSTPTVTIEERALDTLMVTAPKPNNLKKAEEYQLPVYNPSYRLENDLLHTRLDLRFDWEKEHVLGKATLTFKPWFYPVSSLVLDAKGFDIHNINYHGQPDPLKYEYDGQQLLIDLGKTIKYGEEYKIDIDYTAKPAESEGGGSAAISSDQGLFFINPRGEDPEKPMQIWTQGETEWNSRWFPTIDKPNERCTQEMYLTVDQKFKTLSNGLLIDSKNNNDGTRTDYWKMDQPHAPYLFMIAVGEYAVVKDKWKDIVVDYYVEPEYEPHARGIFSNTIEMLDYFSAITGVPYPWQKYSQIVVRDYVSGAMENTTGVIFGEFVQKTDRELIDNHNEGIVAHELFHHWFGDYVTCESWANLTMNEGFANYSEYLWFEHKYGRDEADQHRQNEINGYLQSTNNGGAHPLIHFGHKDKEDMFDAHSYNKGGLVLHMLRNYVGDDAFFASLKKYLFDNAYTAVEAHDLRLAFEEVTGQDLNWFFNQWYFASGHPILDINYEYDTNRVSVIIEQKQNPDDYPPIFILPFAIDVYENENTPARYEVVMSQRKQTFTFNTNAKPLLVNVDGDNILLCEKQDQKTEDNYIFQYNQGMLYQDRFDALFALKDSENPLAKAAFVKALDDPYWAIRTIGLSILDPYSDQAIIKKVSHLAKNDPRSDVRAEAITLLGQTGDQQYISLMKSLVENDRSYTVIASALTSLALVNASTALNMAKKLETEESGMILAAIGDVYGILPSADHLSFFEKNWDNIDNFASFDFFDNYFNIIKTVDDDVSVRKAIEKLNAFGANQEKSPWKRYAAIKAMHDMREEYLARAGESSNPIKKESLTSNAQHITSLIDGIKRIETQPQLKMLIEARF